MTYLRFHLFFIIPPIIALFGLLWVRRRLSPFHPAFIPLIALAALVYTTPWDNYLVATEIWRYGISRVAFTVGYVPIEEYLFFVLQPFLTGAWLMLVTSQWRPEGGVGPTPRTGGMVLFGAVSAIGALMLFTESGRYMGLILVWVGPVLLGQWMLGAAKIWRWRRSALIGLIVPSVYLWIVDGIAISNGIWEIAPETTFRVLLGPLPIEEATFFLMTNLMVIQGLLLFADRDALENEPNGPGPKMMAS